jgi:endonuclease/exonuclease/phosphatase family metal-dependent hydrolase
VLKKILIIFAVFIFASCDLQTGSVVEQHDDYLQTVDNSQTDDTAVDEEVQDNEVIDDQEETDEIKPDNEIEDTDVDDEVTNDEDLVGIEEVSIATYNTYRFFDTVCDSGYCGSNDYEVQFSTTQYKEKIEDIAAALRKINADIVLLQEVEKKICMEDLLEKIGDMYSEIYIGETGGDASVDVAGRTKGKSGDTDKHLGSIPHPDGGTTTFTRAFLEVEIDFGGKKIIVFSAHFKSKSNDDPDRRLAEAMAALEILEDTADNNPDALIVMGGELNDTPKSMPIDTLEDSSDLIRVASDCSDDATYYHNGPEAIDHIFFSHEGAGSYVAGSAEVVKDSPSWYSLMSSDHAAVKADFSFE